MWNVIEKCDFRFFLLQKEFLWIRFRDHAWSFHRLCFDCSTRVFSRRRTRFNSIFSKWQKLDETIRQIRWKRFIKLDENDSSNLIRAISSNLIKRFFIKFDKRHFVKFDEMYFIKFDKRYFIKFDERHFIKHDERHFINFWKRKTIFLLFDKRFHASTHNMKKLSLTKNHLCENKCLCEIVMINERFIKN
jgi:hypothetical protein